MASLQLKGVDFSNSEMMGCQFNGCDSQEANYTGCDLRSTQAVGCNFNSSIFSEADMSFGNFENAKVNKCVSRKAVWDGATGESADFSESDMSGSYFRKSELPKSLFRNSICQGTKFFDAFAGNPSCRQHELWKACSEVEKEASKLQPYSTVASQAAMVLMIKPLQHIFAHHLYSGAPSGIQAIARRLDALLADFMLHPMSPNPSWKI